MILGEARVAERDGQAVLAATLRFDDAGREPFELNFGVPAEFVDAVDPTCNAMLPLATLLAAHLGEDLRVEGPASPRLLAGCTTAASMFAAWWGYRQPAIECAHPAPAERRGDGVGVFYSRGVDTSATLARSLAGEIPERATHLVSGDAIEWAFPDEVSREIWAGVERAAAEIGLPLVRLRSNARELLRGLIGWPRVYGAAYIGAALTLGPMFGHLVTGATQPRDAPQPRGSRFDLDPLWSTEATEVRQDAAELSRAERVAIVARDEGALRRLKVCWEGRGAGNCGRCLKCLRTMTELRIAGVPQGAAPFDAPLTPEAIRAAPLRDLGLPVERSFAEAVPESLPELRAAWAAKAEEAERRRRVVARRSARRRRLRELRRRARRRRRRAVRRLDSVGARLRGAARRGRRALGRAFERD